MTRVVGNPATPGGDVGGAEPHSHPLPTGVRWALVAYGLLFPLVLGAIGLLFLQGQNSDARARAREKASNARQVEHVRAELAAKAKDLADEIDRRKTARDVEAARDRERVRQAVCAFLTDNRPNAPATKRLAVEFRCGLPPLPEMTPQAAPTVQAPVPVPGQPTPQEQPAASPAPRPSASPRSASARPSPRPSPSPACLVRVPGTGTCLVR